MDSPHVSIVTISKSEDEIELWKDKFPDQTFNNYEIVYSTKKGIPEAWKEAISRATGDILIFTETDVVPLSNEWIETIVNDYDLESKDVRYYGEFRGHGSFNFANLAMHPDLAEEFEIDESFPVGEDSEWFARMDRSGVKFEHRPIAPVYHEPRPIDRELDRSFSYGLTNARCIYRHGRLGPEVSTNNSVVSNESTIYSWVDFFTERLTLVVKSLCASLLYWIGLACGFIIYSPGLIKRYLHENL